jgi:hypothetical protein
MSLDLLAVILPALLTLLSAVLAAVVIENHRRLEVAALVITFVLGIPSVAVALIQQSRASNEQRDSKTKLEACVQNGKDAVQGLATINGIVSKAPILTMSMIETVKRISSPHPRGTPSVYYKYPVEQERTFQ